MRTRFTRREILRLAAVLGIAPVLPTIAGCGDSASSGDGSGGGLPDYEYDGPLGPEDLFQHGVASGDPLADAVILWTRLSPESGDGLEVYWEVARDPSMQDRVGAGWFDTNADRDFTVKLDAIGLDAGTTYYYRFRALGRASSIGRTRTAPSGGVDRLRMAVVSCSRYTGGYFHAYRGIAERPDLDVVVHLGDYIYEDGASGPVRSHQPPHEIVTVDDYRGRYAQYRLDPDLQEAHRQHPFVTVWDDHESANNAWHSGASGHNPETDGDWAERRARAERVYSEWLPIRDQDGGQIFRRLQFGDLIDLLMLDTRLWGRDLQIEATNDRDGIRDPSRTMLGFDQEEWFADRVGESSAHWIIAGQQVVLSPWKVAGAPESEGGGVISNTDAWDGYFPARTRLLEALRAGGEPNFIVLTGDIHSSWAFDITEDPNDPAHYDPQTGAGSLGVEFVTPGVTSGFPVPGEAFLSILLQANPHLLWGDNDNRGYTILDVTPERAEAAWYHVDSVFEPERGEHLAAVFAVSQGTNHLVKQAAPTAPPSDPPAPAP
ncbi:MAG: alkaline phosphatase D family protein [Candidatus Binatia bacterium]|nr:alkaline phosphatase D family protein [Candidatus Binatia bacterium]